MHIIHPAEGLRAVKLFSLSILYSRDGFGEKQPALARQGSEGADAPKNTAARHSRGEISIKTRALHHYSTWLMITIWHFNTRKTRWYIFCRFLRERKKAIVQLSLQAVHHLTFSLIDWHTFDESGSETIRPQTKQHRLRAAKNETGGLENAERVIKRVFKEDERRFA